MATTRMQLTRTRKALLRGLLAFALAFGTFFGVFSLGVTAFLFALFLVDDGAPVSFSQYLMADEYYRIYFAVAAVASILGTLWFVVTLIDNLRFNEGDANRMIDRWLTKMDRSNRPDKDSGDT